MIGSRASPRRKGWSTTWSGPVLPTPSTPIATHLAAEAGIQDALVERLHAGYFNEGALTDGPHRRVPSGRI